MNLGELSDSSTGIDIAHAAEAQRTRLRAEAADLGGASPLTSFMDSPESGIDISRAHPGSLPQFITGRSTLLSNLFRDEVGLRTARLAAERITAKHTELRTVRGIDAVHRSEEHTSELQSRPHLVCRLLLEKKNKNNN